MDEAHFKEVEKALLYVSEARERAERGAKALGRAGAEPHLVEALERAEEQLREVHRRLMHGTYFAAPEERDQQQLVTDDPPAQDRLTV